MDPAALAALCSVLAAGQSNAPLPAGVTCPPAIVGPALIRPETAAVLTEALKTTSARDGIARVAFAEAGNQGDSGLAAVVYAILNRLADGRWGRTIDSVLNAHAQFEPVMRAGGDWRGLPPVSAASQARIDTILNLVLDGRLPDLTHGARFFQNPAIVARRARDGVVSAHLVNFGGTTPSAVIGSHRFYADVGTGGGSGGRARSTANSRLDGPIFVELRRTEAPSDSAPAATEEAVAGDPAKALFVGSDGVVRETPR